MSAVAVISSVSYKNVGASVSYKNLGFTASYTEISVFAEATFPDRFIVEVVTPSDRPYKSVTKGRSDLFSVSEDSYFSFGKTAADTVEMQDDTDIEFVLGKLLADTQSLSDAKIIALAKALVDLATASDAKAISLSKALAESGISLNDIQTLDSGKALADDVSLSDSVIAVRLFVREFLEELFATDAYGLEVTKAPFTEGVASSDSDTYSFSKPVSESIVMIDNMDGDITYQVVKVIGELISTPTDSLIRSLEMAKPDSVTLSTTGVAFMTDYADISYFAEDFVGVSSNF